ncbi:hypothetical protein A2U01_0063190, partial [Trifolium medium]|nr:hypothetical protein [Trifolium medium]
CWWSLGVEAAPHCRVSKGSGEELHRRGRNDLDDGGDDLHDGGSIDPKF